MASFLLAQPPGERKCTTAVVYQLYTIAAAFDLRCESVTYISYTTCTRDSPDIYTLSPQASGVYIRQTTCAHGITIKYQLMCNHVWVNQHHYSSMASLYLYRDLLGCNVDLNLMIKTFLMSY